MNAGVMQIFKESEMKTREIKNEVGKNILAAFGIDEELFCEVFNQYGKKSFKDESGKKKLNGAQKKLLSNLLSTGIGADYWMVHGQENKSVNFYYMDTAKNKIASKAPNKFTSNIMTKC